MIVSRVAKRLSRRRFGIVWLWPVAAVSTVMALTFALLVQMEQPADEEVSQFFGDHDALVFLNAQVDLSGEAGQAETERAQLEQDGITVSCTKIEAFVAAPGEGNHPSVFREFSDDCDLEAFGYTLDSGVWSTGPGEVVVTTASGHAVDDQIVGLTPEPLSVVGVAKWRHGTRADLFIAGPGTWQSWGWPEVGSRFPQLDATMTAFIDGGADLARERYQRLSAEAPGASSVEVVTAVDFSNIESASVRDRMPWLYNTAAIVAAIAAAAATTGFRRRFISMRTQQLVSIGMPRWKAASSLTLAATTGVACAAAAGVLVGSVAGAFATPLAHVLSGSVASPAPLPWDPLVRVVLPAVAVTWVLSFTWALASGRSPSESLASPPPASSKAQPMKATLSVIAFVLAVVSMISIGDPAGAFGVVLVACAVAAAYSRRIAVQIARRMPTPTPRMLLTQRRILWRPTTAAAQLSVAALSSAPVIAFLVVMSSAVEADNNIERRPPDVNQALYYPSDDEDFTSEVIELVSGVAGGEVESIRIEQAVDEQVGPITAQPEYRGGVGVVESFSELESVLGATLADGVQDVFEGGGVVWLSPREDSSVWLNTSDGESVPITLDSFASVEASERWANSFDGFISSRTASMHDWTLESPEVVLVGVSEDAAERLPEVLRNAGIATDLVRTYRAEDPFAVTQFMWGLLAIMVVLSVLSAIATSRAAQSSLASQAGALFALGAPRSWLGKVAATEAMVTFASGLFIGLLLGLVISNLGLVAGGFPIAVPWLLVTAFVGTLSFAYAGVAALSAYRVRARVHEVQKAA